MSFLTQATNVAHSLVASCVQSQGFGKVIGSLEYYTHHWINSLRSLEVNCAVGTWTLVRRGVWPEIVSLHVSSLCCFLATMMWVEFCLPYTTWKEYKESYFLEDGEKKHNWRTENGQYLPKKDWSKDRGHEKRMNYLQIHSQSHNHYKKQKKQVTENKSCFVQGCFCCGAGWSWLKLWTKMSYPPLSFGAWYFIPVTRKWLKHPDKAFGPYNLFSRNKQKCFKCFH